MEQQKPASVFVIVTEIIIKFSMYLIMMMLSLRFHFPKIMNVLFRFNIYSVSPSKFKSNFMLIWACTFQWPLEITLSLLTILNTLIIFISKL